tara:strand:+ start:11814 stop:11987 length:174 start_codon:yes stop_codon:yes gene_type:complete
MSYISAIDFKKFSKEERKPLNNLILSHFSLVLFMFVGWIVTLAGLFLLSIAAGLSLR